MERIEIDTWLNNVLLCQCRNTNYTYTLIDTYVEGICKKCGIDWKSWNQCKRSGNPELKRG